MADMTRTALAVGDWSPLGITPSKELAEALQALELIRWTEVGHHPTFDLAGLTAKNAEARIVQLASELAVAITPTGGGWKPIEQAKRQALDTAARRVVALAQEFVPTAVEQLTPAFDAAAKDYVEGVEVLPEDVSSETLIYGGASTVDAFHAASGAAERLRGVSEWVATLHDLFGRQGAVERVLRILHPATPEQLHELDKVAGEQAANPAVQALDPVLLTGARLGVPFAILTPSEASELRQDMTFVGGVA